MIPRICVAILASSVLAACAGSGSEGAGPDPVPRYNSTGSWLGVARDVEVHMHIVQDSQRVGLDVHGDLFLVTAVQDTLRLELEGDNGTPTFNSWYVNLRDSLGQFYGQFLGAFDGANTLVGEVSSADPPRGPFGPDTVALTLQRQ